MSATKEIGGMIKGMQAEIDKAITSTKNEVEAVDSGVQLASEAGESLNVTLEKVDIVKNMIHQVSTAAEEQSASTEQISSDIESVSSIVSQTSESAQQVAGASNEIAELAAGLKEKIEIFTVSSRMRKFKTESTSLNRNKSNKEALEAERSHLRAV